MTEESFKTPNFSEILKSKILHFVQNDSLWSFLQPLFLFCLKIQLTLLRGVAVFFLVKTDKE